MLPVPSDRHCELFQNATETFFLQNLKRQNGPLKNIFSWKEPRTRCSLICCFWYLMVLDGTSKYERLHTQPYFFSAVGSPSL